MSIRPIAFLSILALSMNSATYAAKPINLDAVTNGMSTIPLQVELKTIKKAKDFNGTTHLRLQQYYRGYPVWTGEILQHISKDNKTSQEGLYWEALDQDLQNTPHFIFNKDYADKIIKRLVSDHKALHGKKIDNIEKETIIYIDENNKAHFAFLVSYLASAPRTLPQKPTFIIDAINSKVYFEWDNIQTIEATGGGLGGNPKIGQLMYDGMSSHLPSLAIDRDAQTNTCSMQNSEVTVKDQRSNEDVMTYACASTDKTHNDVYWNDPFDSVNGAYSPANDALYIGSIIKSLYEGWYNIPVLTSQNGPMMLTMRVHEDMENAYWDGKQMTFGDGGSRFYPLVSLGVGAHEVSHGFTEQNSGLKYFGQPGGLNESFSDMAAQAAEFYTTGSSSWQIGPEITKDSGALRYMDEPTKDCDGRQPGDNCSISNVKDFKRGLNVHFSSGIYNKVFYLLSNSPSWDTHKAFDVMVQANRFYWGSFANFSRAACGVIKAAKDYGYSKDALLTAFGEVGIDVSRCR